MPEISSNVVIVDDLRSMFRKTVMGKRQGSWGKQQQTWSHETDGINVAIFSKDYKEGRSRHHSPENRTYCHDPLVTLFRGEGTTLV